MELISNESQPVVVPSTLAPEFNKQIILFDGVCNLCDGFVNFVFSRDPQNHFHFAPIQSDLSKRLLYKYNLPTDVSTIVYCNEVEGKAYTHSTAVINIARGLNGIWSWAGVLLIFPQVLRDFVYVMVAKNRYRMFGKKKEACPYRPGLRKRFLDWIEIEDQDSRAPEACIKYV